MFAVGGNEVNDRGGVAQVEREITPADVGLDCRILGAAEELLAGVVERRHTTLPAPGDVEGGQVESDDTHQAVAHITHDELIDLLAHLAGHAAGHRRSGLGLGHAAILPIEFGELHGVEEGIEQCHLLVGQVAQASGAIEADCLEVGVIAINALVGHRVTEAVDHIGEFADDRPIERGVVDVEHVDHRLDRAAEFLKHQVLILHLGGELGGLEDTLAVPVEVVFGRRG